jgi:hypothetical protein
VGRKTQNKQLEFGQRAALAVLRNQYSSDVSD